MKELTFGYDLQNEYLFDKVNLVIDTSWKLGLIGRNGRGKTTFFKLLQEQLPFSGQIEKQVSFTYFPQNVKYPEELTYYALETLTDFEQWRIEKEMNLLQIDPAVLWRPFNSLSGGEQTKVLLALLFADDTSFPLIDEPTNHLDIKGRQQVASYLKQKRQGFIVVSHDGGFIDEVVDHILSIEKSQIVLYQGNFSVYQQQKKRQDQFELSQNEKLKKEIKRLQKTAAEKAEWSRSKEGDKYGHPKQKGSGAVYDTGFIGARAARTMKRSKTIEQRALSQIQEKSKLLKDIETSVSLRLNNQPSHHKVLFRVQDLQLCYENRPLFRPISFELKQGERIAITGVNGSGKSSLLQFLLGNFKGEMTGQVIAPSHLSISQVRQNFEDNHGTLEEFSAVHHLNYQELLTNLKQLGTKRQVFLTNIEQMSKGQQKRVEMAKSLVTPAELFIWDEPLNYLDLFNQRQLEEVIRKNEPTMLIIEHDQKFIQQVATKTICLEPL